MSAPQGQESRNAGSLSTSQRRSGAHQVDPITTRAPEQDSSYSVVEESPFSQLKINTQAVHHDTFQSHVSESQYLELEDDTQAPADSDPEPSPAGKLDAGRQSQMDAFVLPVETPGLFLIRKSEVELDNNRQQNFKFGPAPNLAASTANFGRPAARSVRLRESFAVIPTNVDFPNSSFVHATSKSSHLLSTVSVTKKILLTRPRPDVSPVTAVAFSKCQNVSRSQPELSTLSTSSASVQRTTHIQPSDRQVGSQVQASMLANVSNVPSPDFLQPKAQGASIFQSNSIPVVPRPCVTREGLANEEFKLIHTYSNIRNRRRSKGFIRAPTNGAPTIKPVTDVVTTSRAPASHSIPQQDEDRSHWRPRIMKCPFPEDLLDNETALVLQLSPVSRKTTSAISNTANDCRRRNPSIMNARLPSQANKRHLNKGEHPKEDVSGRDGQSPTHDEVLDAAERTVDDGSSTISNYAESDASTRRMLLVADKKSHHSPLVEVQSLVREGSAMAQVGRSALHKQGKKYAQKSPLSDTGHSRTDDTESEEIALQLPLSSPGRSYAASRLGRPLRDGDLKGPSGHTHHRTSSPSRIQKAAEAKVSLRQRGQSPRDSKSILSKVGELHADLVNQGRKWQRVIEAKDAELAGLRFNGNQYLRRIAKLNAEKQESTRKLVRYMELSVKLKDHVNEVGEGQISLKTAFQKMKSGLAEAIEHAAEVKRAENRMCTLQGEKDSLVKEARTRNQELEDAIARSADAETGYKSTIELLKDELHEEKIKTSRLEKQIEEANTVQQGFVDALKDIPSSIMSELSKKEGPVAKLIVFGNTIQAKIDEVIALATVVKDCSKELSPAFTIALKDLSMSFKSNMPSPDEIDPICLLDQLKEHFDQVFLDQMTHNGLKDQLSTLCETNAALIGERKLQELEFHSLQQHAEQLKTEFAIVQGNLAEASEELLTLRAFPREDSQLRAKISDLRSKVGVLQASAAQEATRASEEMKTLKTLDQKKTEKIKQLVRKNQEAQGRIKAFDDEKAKYQDACKQKAEKDRKELITKANTTRLTIQHKLQSQIKNLEQKRAEAESDLDLAKGELQKVRDEPSIAAPAADMFQEALIQCREFIKQQDINLQKLEQGKPDEREFERCSDNIQKACSKVNVLQNGLHSLESEAKRQFDQTIKSIEDVRSSWRHMTRSEYELSNLEGTVTESWQQKSINWGTKKVHEGLSAPFPVPQPQRGSGGLRRTSYASIQTHQTSKKISDNGFAQSATDRGHRHTIDCSVHLESFKNSPDGQEVQRMPSGRVPARKATEHAEAIISSTSEDPHDAIEKRAQDNLMYTMGHECKPNLIPKLVADASPSGQSSTDLSDLDQVFGDANTLTDIDDEMYYTHLDKKGRGVPSPVKRPSTSAAYTELGSLDGSKQQPTEHTRSVRQSTKLKEASNASSIRKPQPAQQSEQVTPKSALKHKGNTSLRTAADVDQENDTAGQTGSNSKAASPNQPHHPARLIMPSTNPSHELSARSQSSARRNKTPTDSCERAHQSSTTQTSTPMAPRGRSSSSKRSAESNIGPSKPSKLSRMNGTAKFGRNRTIQGSQDHIPETRS